MTMQWGQVTLNATTDQENFAPLYLLNAIIEQCVIILAQSVHFLN